nr:disease resistance protein RPP13-like isoform X6 [Ipomoea batatas]
MDFAGISTLKSIKLKACCHSAVESAKKIQDEQRDYGNYDMVLVEEETLYGYGNYDMVVIEEETLYGLEHEKGSSEEEPEVDSDQEPNPI